MVRIVKAVFENGAFRPLGGVPYAPGEAVELAVASLAEEADPTLGRLRSAATLQEMYDILAAAPPDPSDPDGGYDIAAALAENRRWGAATPPAPEPLRKVP